MIPENIKGWVIKAIEDFNIASHELGFPENEISAGPVCFHCQQVVEKLLKAYLISGNMEFEKTHDLEHLIFLCSKIDKSFADIDLGNLSDYAVNVRYPDDFFFPSVQDARENFQIASKIKEFILEKLGIDD